MANQQVGGGDFGRLAIVDEVLRQVRAELPRLVREEVERALREQNENGDQNQIQNRGRGLAALGLPGLGLPDLGLGLGGGLGILDSIGGGSGLGQGLGSRRYGGGYGRRW